MKILVVEDDHKIATGIKKGLEQEGHTVDLAFDGEEGLDLAMEKNSDVIVLDLMLPKMNGIEVASTLRKENIHTPILILTGKNVLGEGQLSNAKAQAEFLQKRFRVPRQALLIAEEGEYTTSGQAKYLKEFLAKHNFQGKRVVLLTSAYHLPRAVRMFRSEGLNLPFIPAEKILWSRSLHYRKLIKKLYKSQEMDIRRTFERAGIKALLSGTYESQSEESKN